MDHLEAPPAPGGKEEGDHDGQRCHHHEGPDGGRWEWGGPAGQSSQLPRPRPQDLSTQWALGRHPAPPGQGPGLQL